MRHNKIQILASIGSAVTLLVLTACQETLHPGSDERSAGRTLDDKHITENIHKSMEREPVYKLDGVHVNTFDGVVQLSGWVESEGQKMRAQQVAQNVPGVRQVVNGITLKPMMQPTGRVISNERTYSAPQNPPNASRQTTEPEQEK